MNALEADLERRFRTTETVVDLERRDVAILHPANSDDLISEADFDRDERLPYWADLWPSAKILARALVDENGRGESLIELGCGAGLVTVAAVMAGYKVLATDYYDDAIQFAAANVERNLRGKTVETRMVDWNHMPADLGKFKHVLAADVLYEPRYADLVSGAIAATLDRHGVAIVADPGRIARDAFLDAARERGLTVDLSRTKLFEEGEIRQTVTLIELRWPL
jgi:predicted nicotinamide N-methyase